VSDIHDYGGEEPISQGLAATFREQASSERGFKASLFHSQFAADVGTIEFSSPEQFARTLRATTAKSKASLPWIKLGLFSGERTENDCCRCDAFMRAVTGAECDYDAGLLTALDMALAFRQKA
jgi:hypothetical protein